MNELEIAEKELKELDLDYKERRLAIKNKIKHLEKSGIEEKLSSFALGKDCVKSKDINELMISMRKAWISLTASEVKDEFYREPIFKEGELFLQNELVPFLETHKKAKAQLERYFEKIVGKITTDHLESLENLPVLITGEPSISLSYKESLGEDLLDKHSNIVKEMARVLWTKRITVTFCDKTNAQNEILINFDKNEIEVLASLNLTGKKYSMNSNFLYEIYQELAFSLLYDHIPLMREIWPVELDVTQRATAGMIIPLGRLLRNED